MMNRVELKKSFVFVSYSPPRESRYIQISGRTDNPRRNRRIIPTHRWWAKMKRLSLTILNSCLSFRAVVGLPQPPSMCLGNAAKFCWRILATHPIFLPQLAENSPQPTILQYITVFALANYVAWWSLRTIENTKRFIKKHMPNNTFILLRWLPLQAVPTLCCREWAALTINLVR